MKLTKQKNILQCNTLVSIQKKLEKQGQYDAQQWEKMETEQPFLVLKLEIWS